MAALALGTSMARGTGLFEVELCGEGVSGDGTGEWLLSEWFEKVSAIGEDVFHPKNEVSLLEPVALGALAAALSL